MRETNPIANALKRKFGKVMAFKDLPMGAKLALAHYMAVDGEAWEQPDAAKKKNGQFHRIGKTLNNLFEANMDFFDKKYGHLPFMMALVPREEYEKSLLANFRKNPDMKHLHTIEAFTKEYHEGGPGVNHKDASWPVIFSSFPDELIQDGWNRQHCYLNKKISHIPCIAYIPGVKY